MSIKLTDSINKNMKPRLVKGTRDFSASVVYQRRYIFDTLQKIFVKYGFQPLETPAMENLDTLTGKYGDEGDQLLFKILNSGDYLAKANAEALQQKDSKELLSSISSRALRYDLTVPFARYVALNRNDLSFPYKRYQIQPVWRADKPQRGRYREFYQCDVDVIGTESLIGEAELCQIYDEAFAALGLKVVIRLNNRKLLDALAEYAGFADMVVPITVNIDKLDKIGWDGVARELAKIGIEGTAFDKIKNVVTAPDIATVSGLLQGIAVAEEGIAELQEVLSWLDGYTFSNTLKLDFSLARGLSYYTGCIYEVMVDTNAKGQEKVKMGSIGGGGRYANLTEMFGVKDMSGVGISFGAARIYDVLLELGLFEQVETPQPKVLFLAMDEDALKYAFGAMQQVRKAGVAADIYPKLTKFQKLMKHANKVGVAYTVIVGSEEIKSGLLKLKNMHSGEQQSLSVAEIIAQLR